MAKDTPLLDKPPAEADDRPFAADAGRQDVAKQLGEEKDQPSVDFAKTITDELRGEFQTLLKKARAEDRPTLTQKDIDLATRLALIGGGGPKKRGPYKEEIEHYVHCIRRYQLDPMQRQICAVWRWDSTRKDEVMTVQTQIDGYRVIAQRTGEYAGGDDAVFTYAEDNPIPIAARLTVWRIVKGIRCPFTATARMAEYRPVKGDWMWRRMPHNQLAKCGEALALRKGFPSDLSGLYVDAEMDQAAEMSPPADAPAPDPAMPKTPPREDRETATPVSVYRTWLPLAQAKYSDDKLGKDATLAGKLFGSYLSSIAGATIENPRDCPQDVLDAAEKDLSDNADPRPKDQRE